MKSLFSLKSFFLFLGILFSLFVFFRVESHFLPKDKTTGNDLNFLVEDYTKLPPDSGFTFSNNNSCSGTVIEFVPNVNDDELEYSWNFGDGSTSTQISPSHSFNAYGCGTSNFDVTLTVTDSNGDDSTTTQIVSVDEAPNLSFSDASGNNFDNCSQATTNYSVTVEQNSQTSSCVTNFVVDWGDGSPPENGVSFPISHVYIDLSSYDLTITATGSNGCVRTISYFVKNSSNPSGGIVNPGNTTNICAPTETIPFEITDWGSNALDTEYVIDYGDGETIILYQLDLIQSIYYNSADPDNSQPYPIPHQYFNSSCPTNVPFLYWVRNGCYPTPDPTPVSNIKILSKPEANFSYPNVACSNSSILFTNTTINGYGFNCSVNDSYQWDFGDGSTSTEVNPVHTYTSPGEYEVLLIASNTNCGPSEIQQTICIEESLVPSYDFSDSEGCIGTVISFNNTTQTGFSCNGVVYSWSISYSEGNCGTLESWQFVNGTDENSSNPAIQFDSSGTYTVTLSASNSCGTFESSQLIEIKKPPTVFIQDIADSFCGEVSIQPVANVDTCAPASDAITYEWSFPGGLPSSASTLDPGVITYTPGEDYEISLTVTNSCGETTSETVLFDVIPIPEIINTEIEQTICSGTSTTEFVFESSEVNTTYQWVLLSADSNIDGELNSGTTNTIPSHVLTSNNSMSGTVIYQVTPSIDNCLGIPVSFTVNVLPSPTTNNITPDQEICEGGSLDLLEFTLNNASGTVDYQWYSGDTSNFADADPIAGETGSTYQPPVILGTFYYFCLITFEGDGSCSEINTQPFAVTVNENISLSIDSGNDQLVCEGADLQSLVVTTSGPGAGTVTYHWFVSDDMVVDISDSEVGTGLSFDPGVISTSGTYYYYVVADVDESLGCTDVESDFFTIEVAPDPQVIIAEDQTICEGVSLQPIIATVSGGIDSDQDGTIDDFNFQWYQDGVPVGVNTDTYDPGLLPPGTYEIYCEVTQVNGLGCEDTSNTVTIVVNEGASTTNDVGPQAICIGGNLADLVFTLNNATGNISGYQWYINTSPDFNSATEITVNGNQATYTPVIGDLELGVTYYFFCEISFQGDGSCSEIYTQPFQVTVNEGITLSIDSGNNQLVCQGSDIQALIVSSSGSSAGEVTYNWYISNDINIDPSNDTQVGVGLSYDPGIIDVSDFYYYYAVADVDESLGCSDALSEIFIIEVVDDPEVTIAGDQTVCEGTTLNDITASVMGGIDINGDGNTDNDDYNFEWYLNNVLVSTDPNFYNPGVLAPGPYEIYCKVSQDNGLACDDTSNMVTITVNEGASVSITPETQPEICLGETLQDLTISFTNGVGEPDYQWFVNNTPDFDTPAPIGTNSPTFNFGNPLDYVVGTYYYYCVLTFSEGGCDEVPSQIVEIVINQVPVVSDYEALICSGNPFEVSPDESNGDIIPLNTTYTWSNPTISPVGSISGANQEGTPQESIGQNLINNTTSPATVVYTVTPTSGNCVGDEFDITVTVNPSIIADPNPQDISCYGANDGSISIGDIEGGIPFSTGEPYSITWTFPDGSTSSDNEITGLAPGIYELDILDDGGCPFPWSYEILEPTELIGEMVNSSDITCFGENDGFIDVEVSGGSYNGEEPNYNFSWTKDGVSYADTEDISNLGPGVYQLTFGISDVCYLILEDITIEEPPLLTVALEFTPDVIECYGAVTGEINVVVQGGTEDYTFMWTGPNGFTSNEQNINNLEAGDYQLVITDSNDCVPPDPLPVITLTQNEEIMMPNEAYDIGTIRCDGDDDGSITIYPDEIIGGVPPYEIEWDNEGNGWEQTNLSPGIYTATITDSLGCSKDFPLEIVAPPIFRITPDITQISCYGEDDASIHLNLEGGVQPVTVLWADDSSAGVERNNLSAGTYSVIITDSSIPLPSCSIERSFTIDPVLPLQVSAVVIPAWDCDNVNSGSVNLSITGGTLAEGSNYQIEWSNGATTEDLENIGPGFYNVFVEDDNGCWVEETWEVTRFDPLELEILPEVVYDCETREVDITFVATASGGVPGYVYSWSSGNVSGPNNEYMTTDFEGAVQVTVTDNNQCEQIQTYNVEIPIIGFPDFSTTSTGYTSYGFYSILDPIQFTNEATGDFESIVWDFGDGNFSNEENPVHTYTQEGPYVVTQTVTYAFGCVYEHVITLEVEKGYALIFPNAFTPNEDGLNDRFLPKYIGLQDMQLNVYDTWGSLIYSESGDTLIGWDGKLKGNYAENGNYYYTFTGQTFYGRELTSDGAFTYIK